MRYTWAIIAVMAAAAVAATARPAGATGGILLEDHNSIASFNPYSPALQYGWVVDNENYLVEQGFWYRIDGQEGGEKPICQLSTAPYCRAFDTNGDKMPDFLRIRYDGAGLKVEVIYSLIGGSTGSGRADLGETVRITNTGTAPTTVHFFQYADFNLTPYPHWDMLEIRGGNTASQTAGPYRLAETVDAPAPSRVQAGVAADILGQLMDESPTTLTNFAGPLTDDVGWAFQWDFSLAPGEAFLISKDKGIVVPEPATLCLLGLGAVGIAARRFRRSAK